MTFNSRKEALAVIGGLSEPSKMPCYGYSLPAQACIMGAKLRTIQGSVCSKCYALKGRYVFKKVKTALERRISTINNPRWVPAMIHLIKGQKYFRWHDSGDIQSLQHLYNTAQIAKATPETTHWLPTREYQIVKEFCNVYNVPKNLIIRLSAMLVNGPAPEALARELKVYVSGVSKGEAFNCPASLQEGKCMDCRACWDKKVFNVTYKSH